MARSKKAQEETPEIVTQGAEPVEAEAPAPVGRKATVACTASIRRKPNGPVIGIVPAGTPVTVVGSRDGFARLSSGVFLKEDFLKK